MFCYYGKMLILLYYGCCQDGCLALLIPTMTMALWRRRVSCSPTRTDPGTETKIGNGDDSSLRRFKLSNIFAVSLYIVCYAVGYHSNSRDNDCLRLYLVLLSTLKSFACCCVFALLCECRSLPVLKSRSSLFGGSTLRFSFRFVWCCLFETKRPNYEKRPSQRRNATPCGSTMHDARETQLKINRKTKERARAQ
jgi:hypothetical protein